MESPCNNLKIFFIGQESILRTWLCEVIRNVNCVCCVLCGVVCAVYSNHVQHILSVDNHASLTTLIPYSYVGNQIFHLNNGVHLYLSVSYLLFDTLLSLITSLALWSYSCLPHGGLTLHKFLKQGFQ